MSIKLAPDSAFCKRIRLYVCAICRK